MVSKKTLNGLTLEACKVTEHKHQRAADVGGELNLIRASKKPVFARFRRRCGKPSQAKISLHTPHFFYWRYYLGSRDISLNRTMIKLESYWKDILFGYRADTGATAAYKSKNIKTSTELLTYAPALPARTLACPCNSKPLARQPNCCITLKRCKECVHERREYL